VTFDSGLKLKTLQYVNLLATNCGCAVAEAKAEAEAAQLRQNVHEVCK